MLAGELTLRGLVLPVGGIKEKLLAAQAAGMTRVLIPARNMPDVLVRSSPLLLLWLWAALWCRWRDNPSAASGAACKGEARLARCCSAHSVPGRLCD